MAAAGLFLGLLLLWLRVAWLQVVEHGTYEARAERNQEQRVRIRPERGELRDRRGRPLARDLPTYSIAAAPREMKDARAVARQLAGLTGLDPRRLERDFAARPRFQWVARQVSPAVGQRVGAQNWRGVYLSVETRREYLLGAAAGEVLGRTDLDNTGVEGLELGFDDALRGHPGWATLFRDGRGNAISAGTYTLRYELQPNDGNHLGTSPTPDFLLLVPVAADTNPAQTYSFDQLVRLSEQVTGKKHPAPFNLVPADAKQFPSVTTDPDDHTILFFKVKTQSGDLPFGLVVKGTAAE